jgi:thioredoxin-related protein
MLEISSIISFFMVNTVVVFNFIPNTCSMKRVLPSIAVLLLLSLSSIAQRGVNFISGGNLRTVFDLAKVQNKAVFLEAYAPTCHVCMAFKPTFENQQVGDIYNKNYISYKLDMTSPEAAGFYKNKIFGFHQRQLCCFLIRM